MKKKLTCLAMMGLVLVASIGCTTILDIDHEYHDCAPNLYCGGNECVDESKDSKNCGSCGHDCQGGECREGQCQPVIIAYDQLYPSYIVVDAKNIYWTNRGSALYSVDGSVMKMPINGETPIAIATDQKTPRCIAVDATHVYWTNARITPNMPNTGTVMRVAIDGSNLTELAKDQNNPYDIFVTDEFIFWTNEGTHPNDVSPPQPDGSIMKLKRGDTTATPFVTGLNYPQGIAVDKTSVYWTDAEHLRRMPFEEAGTKDPTQLGDLVTNKRGFSRITMDETNLYWTNTDGNSVNKVGITGSMLAQLAANTGTPFGIAVDANSVYWTSSEDGTVTKVGINGGIATTLASAQGAPIDIAVNATTIYWTNAIDGTVMKVAK